MFYFLKKREQKENKKKKNNTYFKKQVYFSVFFFFLKLDIEEMLWQWGEERAKKRIGRWKVRKEGKKRGKQNYVQKIREPGEMGLYFFFYFFFFWEWREKTLKTTKLLFE